MLACPIENYTFRASTPTEELMVMCRMLSDVGDYASTILDRAHQAFSRKSLAINKKVEKELMKRKVVATIDEVYDVSTDKIDRSDLSALSIDQLEILYRQWKIRFNERLHDRRETLTRFFESRIVREMKSRRGITAEEHLKIDYCDRTNRDELNNIGAIMQLPLGTAYLDIDRCKTPREMICLIERLAGYKTVYEREMLIETVEKAIDFIRHNPEVSDAVNLASELVGLNYRGIVSSPEWVNDYLAGTVAKWEKQPLAIDREKIIPFLSQYPRDKKAKWRAVRILNTCYERAMSSDFERDNSESISELIEDLYIAEQCHEFVTRYKVRKMAATWNRLCDHIVAGVGFASLSTPQITKLLYIADENSKFTTISPEHVAALDAQISHRSTAGEFEADIYKSNLPHNLTPTI